MTGLFLLLSISLSAQLSNTKTETAKVFGNCGMCEDKIETAGTEKKVSEVSWNKDTKTATISYDSKQTSKDAVLKKIALAGYDNEAYLAPDDVYQKLPACCHYARNKETPAENASGHDHNAMAVAQDSGPLKQVTDSYFELKDALVQSSGELASKKAKSFYDALAAIKMESLKGESHDAWMKVNGQLKEDAEHISETKDISHQRDHFNSLSKSMYALLKASPAQATIYYQHCPMFNDGKGGNWLSKENGIKNPFYGSQMLTCGKTVETLK